MLKRLLLVAMVWLCASTVAHARERYWNYCQKGGYQVTTQGLKSTEYFQRTFRSCTVHVYNAGTAVLATLYSDNLAPVSTPLANPFTSAADGYFEFYATAGRYDVQITDTPSSTQYTWGDITLCDPIGPLADTSCAAASSLVFHNLLSSTHPDTVAYSPPQVGDLIRGNLNQFWERFAVGQLGQVLAVVPVGGQSLPDWVWPNTLDTCVSVQDNGTETGCEHEINFIPGSNISLTIVDDNANDRTNVTIAASGTLSACPNLTQVTDLYVATTGNDSTGDGTVGNPWLTIKHAVDTGVPGLVCGRYIIHLAAGTYTETLLTIGGRIFAGGGVGLDVAMAEDSFWPISGDTGDVTDNTWPYSWIEIVGSTAAPASYVIKPYVSSSVGIALSHAYLTLRGVQIQNSGYGVKLAQRSLLNLAGVIFTSNSTHIYATEQSVVHLDASGYINDAHTDTVLFTETSASSNNGVLLTDGSILTDYDTGGADPGTRLDCTTSGSGAIAACINAGQSAVNMKGHMAVGYASLNASQKGLNIGFGSHVYISNFAYTGSGTPGSEGTAIFVSGASTVDIDTTSITNADIGVATNEDSYFVGIPSFTGVVLDWSTAIDTGTAAIDTHSWHGGPAKYRYVLTGNVTVTSATGRDGDAMTLLICQDGVGNHTFALPANVKGAGTVAATASTCNAQTFVFDQPSGNWYATSAMVTGQ